MDCFESLPNELQLEIFKRLNNSAEAKSLAYASPTMYRQFRYSANYLKKHLVTKDLCGDLLQDALAVILFPTRDPQAPGTELEWKQIRHFHLMSWGAKELPNPLREDNPEMINILSSLTKRLLLFMEDYLVKATSPRMSRAYLRIPQWAHPSLRLGLHFDRASRSCNSVRLWSLTPEEFKRLMQAFLRYELLCKIYRPCPAKRVDRDGLTELGEETFSTLLRLETWNWELLQSYECQEGGLPRFQEGCENARDFDMLQCVFEYVRTLHGAIASQINLYWYIPAKRGLETPTGGLQNDELDFLNDSWHVRCTWVTRSPWPYHFDTTLVACGFNLIAKLLTTPNPRGREKFYHQFFAQVIPNRDFPDLAPYNLRPAWWKIRDEMNQDYHQNLLEISKRPLLKQIYRDRPFWSMAPGQEDFLRFYRQRAWAFFDDERFYPKSCALSKYPDFATREKAFLTRIHELKTSRAAWYRKTMRTGPEFGQEAYLHNPALEWGCLSTWGKTAFWDNKHSA